MLEGGGHAIDLALVGRTTQLPRELGALGQAGRAEGVALGDQPAGRVHDPLPAVRRGALVDQVRALAFAAEPEGLVGQQLVGGEAVVQLDDLEVLGPETRLLVDLAGGLDVMS